MTGTLTAIKRVKGGVEVWIATDSGTYSGRLSILQVYVKAAPGDTVSFQVNGYNVVRLG